MPDLKLTLWGIIVILSTRVSAQVGIGTTSPTVELDIESAAATTSLDINNTAADGDPVVHFQLSGTSTFSLGVDDGDSDKFKIGTSAIGTSTRLTIDASGYVGIGTSSPTVELDVESAASTTSLDINNTAGDGDPVVNFQLSGTSTFSMGIDDGDSDKLKIGTSAIGTNTRLTIDASGNVGIGTTSPTTLVSVEGNFDGAEYEVFSITRTSATPADADDIEFQVFHENDNNENVNVASIWFGAEDVTDGTEDGSITFGAMSNGTLYSVVKLSSLEFIPSGDNVSSLGASGSRWTELWSVNGTIQTSDMRLKRDVRKLEYGLDDLMKVNPITFKWKPQVVAAGPQNGRFRTLAPKNDLHREKIGFSAQEIQEIFPEIVVRGKDPAGRLGINYGEFAPILVKAVQEQQAEIESLKSEVRELKRLLYDLSKDVN